MSKFYKISVDANQLYKTFSDLPEVTKKATANTVNIVARKANKNLKAHITETYNVPKSAMKFGKLVSLKRANARTNLGKATIFIKVKGRGLMKYGAKQIGPGVSVRIKKTTKTIKHAFISPIKKGGPYAKFVFIKSRGDKAGKIMRRSKAGTPYEAAKREVMYGPPIADLYTNRGADKILMKTIDDEFQTTLDEQFNKQFEKGGRR